MLKFEGKSFYGDDIHLSSDVNPKGNLDEVYYTKGVSGGELSVGYTNIEKVYTYGLISNRDYMGHGPGYVWSSRVGCLNLEFGTDFVEVVINNCAGYCMHSTDLIKLLPDGCYFERVECFDDKEPYYRLRGFYDLQWFANNEGINQFNTTEKIQVTDAEEINIDGFTLKSTNYDGVYVFDTLESLSSKYPTSYTHYYNRPKRETNWSNAPKELKDAFIEVYVDYKYGYCASKEMLKEKYPERFRYSF
jgi:hypothetical protein